MVQQRARRRDRIGAEKHVEPGKLATRNESERQRLGAGDRAVEAWFRWRSSKMVLLEGRTHFDSFAISVTGVERGDIRLGKFRRLGELGVQPVDDGLPV